jgi:hypothetical protein
MSQMDNSIQHTVLVNLFPSETAETKFEQLGIQFVKIVETMSPRFDHQAQLSLNSGYNVYFGSANSPSHKFISEMKKQSPFEQYYGRTSFHYHENATATIQYYVSEGKSAYHGYANRCPNLEAGGYLKPPGCENEIAEYFQHDYFLDFGYPTNKIPRLLQKQLRDHLLIAPVEIMNSDSDESVQSLKETTASTATIHR